MSKTTASARQLVRSVLAEAYTGAAAVILRKYYLIDEQGNPRITTIRANPEKDIPGVPGPVLSPTVVDRFLTFDKSSGKRLFDWMLYAAAGGEQHIKESERSIELAKTWVVENRMKGLGREETPIKPMTREEAEADWLQNEYPMYRKTYLFADEDLAGDIQYPCFGWFRDWPGRNHIYEKVVDAVGKFLALLKDKKLVSQWNKFNPREPIRSDMASAFWTGANRDEPVYKDVETLLEFVNSVPSTLLRRRAETHVITVGKAPEGGYRTGTDEVLYDDEKLRVVVPLTAAAALKKGFNDWCISNRTRWETYFRTKRPDDLPWGSVYVPEGPFAFVYFKVPVADPYMKPTRKASDPPALAAHVMLAKEPDAPDRIDFWDQQNRRAIRYTEILQRLENSVPGTKPSFDAAIAEIEAWLKQFKHEQIELFPALEAMRMARQLVSDLLNG
jgi:hypothetical protein